MKHLNLKVRSAIKTLQKEGFTFLPDRQVNPPPKSIFLHRSGHQYCVHVKKQKLGWWHEYVELELSRINKLFKKIEV